MVWDCRTYVSVMPTNFLVLGDCASLAAAGRAASRALKVSNIMTFAIIVLYTLTDHCKSIIGASYCSSRHVMFGREFGA